jgi:hypothetical protein
LQDVLAISSNYTLTPNDVGKLLYCTNSSAITIYAPDYWYYEDARYSAGSNFDIIRGGSGAVTVAAFNDATVNAVPGLKLREQYSAASLVMVGDYTLILAGDLAE